MIVCICHRVSDRDIARVAQAGCPSFDDLQFELSVATACGKCHDCALATFERHAGPLAAAQARLQRMPPAPHSQVFPIALRPHGGQAASANA